MSNNILEEKSEFVKNSNNLTWRLLGIAIVDLVLPNLKTNPTQISGRQDLWVSKKKSTPFVANLDHPSISILPCPC